MFESDISGWLKDNSNWSEVVDQIVFKMNFFGFMDEDSPAETTVDWAANNLTRNITKRCSIKPYCCILCINLRAIVYFHIVHDCMASPWNEPSKEAELDSVSGHNLCSVLLNVLNINSPMNLDISGEKENLTSHVNSIVLISSWFWLSPMVEPEWCFQQYLPSFIEIVIYLFEVTSFVVVGRGQDCYFVILVNHKAWLDIQTHIIVVCLSD